MTSIDTDGAGGPEVMQPATCPLPVPKTDEVLIQVLAAGVNRPDIAQRQGSYPPPPGASPILGLEVSGEVVATGSAVTNREIGDLVCALTNGGGYAEYCSAPASQCLPWPLWPVLDTGRCGPVVHATFPLDQAAAAHRLMESSEHIGKIMLTVG